MRLAIWLTRLSVLLLATAVAACGDGRAVEFSVDGNKPINTLTSDEMATMCTEMAPQMDRITDLLCIAASVSAKFEGGDAASCRAAYDVCMAEESSEQMECLLGSGEPEPYVATCEATVGEVEDCMNEVVALLNDVRSRMSCDMTLADMLSIDQSKFEDPPPACEKVNAKCPGFMEDQEAGGGAAAVTGEEEDPPLP